jgi:hypothetical protein
MISAQTREDDAGKKDAKAGQVFRVQIFQGLNGTRAGSQVSTGSMGWRGIKLK